MSRLLFLLTALSLSISWGLAASAAPILGVSEIWSGQPGSDVTEDWFEIVNTGDMAWTSGFDGDLFYDDDSQDPADAVLISGIGSIAAGGTAIVVLGVDTDAIAFSSVWSGDVDLTGVAVGYADGSGLGSGGDGVTLWIGDPNAMGVLADFQSYPDTAGGASSWDVGLGAFSTAGVGGAVDTTTLGGSNGMTPATGSPGVANVPEPSLFAAVGLGLFALARRGRRPSAPTV